MRIAFFIHNEWAFGSIHYELAKYLHPHDIDATVINWSVSYSTEEMLEYDRQVDLFVTIPQGLLSLHSYGIPLEKCHVIFHSDLDIIYYNEHISAPQQAAIGRLGAVSLWLLDRSKELNVNREVIHLPLGINYKRHYATPSTELKSIGYAGTFLDRDQLPPNYLSDPPGWGPNLHKRAYIIKELAEKLNLKFVVASKYHNTFITMAGFYPTVDCVMCASIKEGAGLPMMEAGPSGKLVLTTQVGHFNERITENGAILLPLDEEQYKIEAEKLLRFYIDNPEEYRKKCAAIQEHAKSYDWSNVVQHWVSMFTTT
jgi:glycosyltransferase involved in cell wall biosynthesis